MGSSGGTQSFRQPSTPAPPPGMVAGPGQTAPFNPSYVNFLGDTNVPSTGLTPGMLQQIDSGSYMPQPAAPSTGMPPPNWQDQLRSEMAKIIAEQQQPKRGFQPRARGAQRNSGGR